MTPQVYTPNQEAIQRERTRLIVRAGQLLHSHGAETRLIVDIVERMGRSCGLDEVDISISARAMIVTTIMQEHCITTARRCPDLGINMRVVTDVQRICILLEKGITDTRQAKEKLNQIKPQHYPANLVVLMVGLSCASFSRLAGAGWEIFAITFIAASCAMWVRQQLGKRHFNPMLNFSCTAFIATLISSQAVIYQIGNQPFLAMASSVLLLVPGFPLINSVADLIKGHTNMGIARFVFASMLSFATCLGILLAMSITNTWGWLN
ncbi:MAG: threonine/serine ThrE exporter family protein [Vibrio sp.]